MPAEGARVRPDGLPAAMRTQRAPSYWRGASGFGRPPVQTRGIRHPVGSCGTSPRPFRGGIGCARVRSGAEKAKEQEKRRRCLQKRGEALDRRGSATPSRPPRNATETNFGARLGDSGPAEGRGGRAQHEAPGRRKVAGPRADPDSSVDRDDSGSPRGDRVRATQFEHGSAKAPGHPRERAYASSANCLAAVELLGHPAP